MYSIRELDLHIWTCAPLSAFSFWVIIGSGLGCRVSTAFDWVRHDRQSPNRYEKPRGEIFTFGA